LARAQIDSQIAAVVSVRCAGHKNFASRFSKTKLHCLGAFWVGCSDGHGESLRCPFNHHPRPSALSAAPHHSDAGSIGYDLVAAKYRGATGRLVRQCEPLGGPDSRTAEYRIRHRFVPPSAAPKTQFGVVEGLDNDSERSTFGTG